MTKHPLTNKKAFKKFWDHTVDVTTEVLYTPDGIRAAYDLGRDEQLEKVMKWLDKNLRNYTDDTYLGDCNPLHILERHLKEAMRPQEDNS
jgi:hypothetical protein